MHPNRLIGPIITTLSLASVPTVAQPLEPLPGIVEDAQRLDQPTAEARFDALTALLDDYGLTYEVQTFSNPRATEAGPTEGHNLIVDIGEGERDLVVGAHYDAAPLEDGLERATHADEENGQASRRRAQSARMPICPGVSAGIMFRLSTYTLETAHKRVGFKKRPSGNTPDGLMRTKSG